MEEQNRKRKIKFNKRIVKRNILIISTFILLVFIIIKLIIPKKETTGNNNTVEVAKVSKTNVEENNSVINNKKLDWKLTLVNQANKLPENYEMKLSSIDQYRKFDSRAIKYLQDMIEDMREEGVSNIWVQSSYRSVEEQETVYNNKVKYYKEQGKTEKEAKRLTEETINKPGHSEHSLGLAVDFNYVNGDFEETKAFKWLKENGEEYGFILRYPKEKENITKVTYEPWHWRYVGKENAKKINELGMCLEEYVESIM